MPLTRRLREEPVLITGIHPRRHTGTISSSGRWWDTGSSEQSWDQVSAGEGGVRLR